MKFHGTSVDWDNRTARIPAELADQALSTAPAAFVLGAGILAGPPSIHSQMMGLGN
jgi:trimethylamine:corrinoid methyltransferase-like protein